MHDTITLIKKMVKNMIKKGTEVYLIKEPETKGFVIKIDNNFEDITTCNVIWNAINYQEAKKIAKENKEFIDIQWTNKLAKY